MQLSKMIEAGGDRAIVDALATKAGLERGAAAQALGVLLPEFGRAIREACAGPHGASALRAAASEARYQRYLDDPAALADPAAADGERVLSAVLNDGERRRLTARASAASPADNAQIRTLMPIVASLAMAVIGRQLNTPGIRWFGSRQSDHLDAPLLNAVAALFDDDDH